MTSPVTQAARLMERHAPWSRSCANSRSVPARLRSYGFARAQLVARKSSTWLLWSTATRTRPDGVARWQDGTLTVWGEAPRHVQSHSTSGELGPYIQVSLPQRVWDAIERDLGAASTPGQKTGATLRAWFDNKYSSDSADL